MNTKAPLALVTGASSGIGLELARKFADNGYDLVVAAEDAGVLELPARLGGSTSVRPVRVDLRDPAEVERLYREVVEGGRPLAAAALNAGVGMGDSFVNSDLADDMSVVDLNVRSTVHLAKLVLRDMAARNEGKVVFTPIGLQRVEVLHPVVQRGGARRVARHVGHRHRSHARSHRHPTSFIAPNSMTPLSERCPRTIPLRWLGRDLKR